VHYNPGKTNVIADALSHKTHCNYLPVACPTGEESNTRVLPDLLLYNITLMPILRDEITASQKNDKGMAHIKRTVGEGDSKVACIREDVEGTLWFKDSLVVLKKEALKNKILDEAHTSRYLIHLGSTKMYHDLREQFWWTCMKRKAACYVLECDTCQKVEVDYMKPGGLLQQLSIPDWNGMTLAWTSSWACC
jgi:hypothetical protein